MNLIRIRSRQQGFSLIELMVVVAIVAILVRIAIPAYRQYAMRVKRVDATRELMSVAGRLERCYTRTNNYTRLDDVPNVCVTLPYTNAEGTYVISGTITANAFSLTATPQAGQANDTKCAAFTINQLGQQGITGSGTAQGCWGGRGS